MAETGGLHLKKRIEILCLREHGKSYRDIAKTLKYSIGTVYYALKHRGRFTTVLEDYNLVRTSLKNPQKTSSESALEVSEQVEQSMSALTMRRRLNQAGKQD
ncbi:uncharacterized protein [Euwallacea similis]|uniref:uncharacterized protein n=1 Tax=Euwallacea similis TaxID=1736056 RepID=UPI0034503852